MARARFGQFIRHQGDQLSWTSHAKTSHKLPTARLADHFDQSEHFVVELSHIVTVQQLRPHSQNDEENQKYVTITSQRTERQLIEAQRSVSPVNMVPGMRCDIFLQHETSYSDNTNYTHERHAKTLITDTVLLCVSR